MFLQAEGKRGMRANGQYQVWTAEQTQGPMYLETESFDRHERVYPEML